MSKVPNPTLLEEKIRENMKTDAKFAFLNDADPYHQYYRYMIEKVKEDLEDAAKGIAAPPKVEKKVEDNGLKAYEPKNWEFKVDMPGVTAMDL
jgi:splicing factor 3A subunit 1